MIFFKFTFYFLFIFIYRGHMCDFLVPKVV